MEPTSINNNLDNKLKDLIQIQVSKDEVQERILTFINKKRKEIDETNVQEFCNHKLIHEDDPNYGLIDSCARVDAVLIPRIESKSRSKISKVKNKRGPQGLMSIETESQIERQRNFIMHALEERLWPIVSCLNINIPKVENRSGSEPIVKRIKTESPEEYKENDTKNVVRESSQPIASSLYLDAARRKNIIQRIKKLEDSIIRLEAKSPEIFQLTKSNHTSPQKNVDEEKMRKKYANWSIDEIQKRIQVLKESFQTKPKNVTKMNES